MVAGASLTLALVHGLVWVQHREARASLFLALMAAGTVGMAGCELGIINSETIAAYDSALRWYHLPVWLAFVGAIGFLQFYLRAGRSWLAWTACGARTLSLIVCFLCTPNPHYRTITAIHQVPFLGGSATVGEGVPNPWILLEQLSLGLLLLYLVDAAVTAWRGGDRRRALTVGGSFIFFVSVSLEETILVSWGFLRMPIAVSPFYLAVVTVMVFELSRDLLRAARLANELQAKETELSGRLIHAQEEERARLARELHDDVSQRLARLAIDAGSAERGPPGPALTETMREIRKGLVRLSEDVHALSYRLHPALLEDLGLVAALRAECDRFARQESIPTDVKLGDMPATVPLDVALCLFRVTQEALRNVARHARAHTVEVSLLGFDGGLQLAVRDDGVGFDPALQRKRPSLGLASMRERVRFLGGELSIESQSGGGATILAWVPLKGESA